MVVDGVVSNWLQGICNYHDDQLTWYQLGWYHRCLQWCVQDNQRDISLNFVPQIISFHKVVHFHVIFQWGWTCTLICIGNKMTTLHLWGSHQSIFLTETIPQCLESCNFHSRKWDAMKRELTNCNEACPRLSLNREMWDEISSSSSNFIPNRIQQYNTVCMTYIANSRVIIDIVMWFCWWPPEKPWAYQAGSHKHCSSIPKLQWCNCWRLGINK